MKYTAILWACQYTGPQKEQSRTFHQLWQVSKILGLYSDSHDRGHTELHDPHIVSILECCDGTRFDQKLIHTPQSTDVTCKAKMS
jgi:hypothetical protein